MARSRRINQHASTQRTGLRTLGAILAVVGGIFAAVGMVSFFSSFGAKPFESSPPDKFWCAFVGVPMLGIGLTMLKIGYMGTIARYVAGETAPVVSDTLNYVADETKDSIRKVVSSAAAGLRTPTEDATTSCPACGHNNDHDARFCDHCGKAMPGPKACGNCGNVNDHDARFCDDCGTALT